MLEDFKVEQEVAYSMLVNSIKSGKLSHAYLINSNGNKDGYKFALAFVKAILCSNNYTINNDKCDNCSICSRIDSHNYPEFKIIESDSLVIKKEQLLELQNEFSRSCIEGNYRIYIIKDCDKMNKQASNCLLKFLEEPVPGIIAILLTDNFNKILSTIVSRCQIVTLNNTVSLSTNSTLDNFLTFCCNNIEEKNLFLDENGSCDIIENVIDFIDYYEENGLDILIFMKNMWYNKVKTREEALRAFFLMVMFYYDVLKVKLKLRDYFFCDKVSNIEKIASKNSIEEIIYKIEIVTYGYEMVRSNLNINLLIDDIVIRLGEYNEYCRS